MNTIIFAEYALDIYSMLAAVTIVYAVWLGVPERVGKM